MDLTDEQWVVLEPLVPGKERCRARKRGQPWTGPGDVLNGVLMSVIC